MSKFEIDFSELAFLAEACIPPRPIARSMFWNSLIDEHYFTMSIQERNHLFDWLKKSIGDRTNEGIELFLARYDPQNQYKVTCIYQGKTEIYECFLLKNRHYTKKDRFIADEYITNIEQNTERINIQ